MLEPDQKRRNWLAEREAITGGGRACVPVNESPGRHIHRDGYIGWERWIDRWMDGCRYGRVGVLMCASL